MLFSLYKGGETARFVLKEINRRWGKEAADKYDPYTNCFTFRGWLERGFVVKKGEKAIRSVTFIKEEEIDPKTKKLITVRTHPKNVYLFYFTQVEKLKPKIK